MDTATIIKTIKEKPGLVELTDEEITWFVDCAVRKCLSIRFPFNLDAKEEDIDKPYFHRWIISASIAMIESMGVGNIKSYSEIGVSISYVDMVDGIPKHLINEMLPMAGTI